MTNFQEVIVDHLLIVTQLLFMFFDCFNLKRASRLYETGEHKVLVKYLRLKDCHTYLCMSRNRFADEVKPFLVPIPIGERGIAYDILDLDAWADQYKARSGRPQTQRRKLWDAKERQVSLNVRKSGTLISRSSVA